MISTQVPAMVPNESAMRRPQLNPFAIRHTPGEVRVNALVPRAATSARERLATRRQGRFARTIPSTRRTFPRIPAVTKRTLPASNGSARPTGYANPRRRELTKVRVRPWVPPRRGRCSRSVKRSSRSRSTVSLARIVVAIAPSAGTETSRTPRVTLRWAVTGRRPTRSGRSVKQTATVQRSASIRRRATWIRSSRKPAALASGSTATRTSNRIPEKRLVNSAGKSRTSCVARSAITGATSRPTTISCLADGPGLEGLPSLIDVPRKIDRVACNAIVCGPHAAVVRQHGQVDPRSLNHEWRPRARRQPRAHRSGQMTLHPSTSAGPKRMRADGGRDSAGTGKLDRHQYSWSAGQAALVQVARPGGGRPRDHLDVGWARGDPRRLGRNGAD